jgi:NAD(P)-dependent dehydrogenase (short-subunit alcohol dehydrogenase family)
MVTMPPIPSMKGKLVLVTGSNTGIGKVTALVLAKAGAHVVMANRSQQKTMPVLKEIAAAGGSAEFLSLDLNDLDAVKRSAETFLKTGRAINVLVNNAGLVRIKEKTKQGFEATMGVNHLGHYLFTRLLLPAVEKGAPARVVVVASRAHERMLARKFNFDWFHADTGYTGWRDYQRSKLCNVLFSRELSKRVDPAKVCTYAVHPGPVATDIWRIAPAPLQFLARSFFLTAEEGARAQIACAADPEKWGLTGRYWGDRAEPRQESKLGRDDALAKELWEKSEEFVRAWL